MWAERIALLFVCVFLLVSSAFGGPAVYQGEWYTDRDYGYAYGFDFYDHFGDYGYVGPGAIEWDAEWFPRRNYTYEGWGGLDPWFRDKHYLSYEAALEAGAKTAAELPGARQAHIKGTVAETAVAPVGKLNRPHVLITVKTCRGEIFRIDLGPDKPQLRELNVRPGQQAEVTGIIVRVRKQDVVLAHWVRVENAQALLGQHAPLRLRGRIADWTDLNTADLEEAHRIVMLETESGKLAVILGPSNRAQVRKGQSLIVEGRLERVRAGAYAVAHRFRVERRR